MTRWGVLSDVHANLAALDAAIGRLEPLGVDRWISAGDAVGYGPDPNEVIARLVDLDARAVAGNHELFLRDELPAARFVGRALASLAWTRRVLEPASWDYIRKLPDRQQLGPIAVAHGSLDDPTEYVTGRRRAAQELARGDVLGDDVPWLVLGHTHQQLAVTEEARRQPILVGRPRRLDRRHRYLLNPGSVGQSRQLERRPRARFMVIDTQEPSATWFAIPYDDRATRLRLEAAGLPPTWVHVRPSLKGWIVRTARSWIA